MTTVGEIIARIEAFAPPYLAEKWDPIGLAFGSKDNIVKNVMVALDLDTDTLTEAKEKNIDFIFTHHPSIFSSLQTLNADDSRRKEYIDLIQSDIALYSAHTNLDAAEGGMNDWLADAIGLPLKREIVEVTHIETYKKIAVYVPEYASNKVREAMHEAGAGEVGNYKDVSYTLTGYGRFTPQEGSDPFEGEVGETEVIKEERIEMMMPSTCTSRVIQAVNRAHPYEEPVYDIFTLEDKGKAYGYGRIATLEVSVNELAKKVKEVFSLDSLRIASKEASKKCSKVAIFGGSGEKYYKKALEKEADIYITGDVSYHGAQDMLRDGLNVIDPGHYIEQIMVPEMTKLLRKWNDENNWQIEIFPSKKQKDVFQFR